VIISRSNSCPKCGDDHGNSCYIVYHDGYHCFSCGASSRKSAESFAFRELRIAEERNLFIPHHTLDINEFSPQCLRWLYSYYVTDKLIKQNKIAFCPSIDRDESILFPVLIEDGNLVEYQRRFFPKNFYSSGGVKKTTFISGNHENTTYVLVEDYISAIRVGQFFNCLCLFGTSLTSLNKYWLTQHADKILVWLDNDEPGILAAKKIEGELIEYYRKLFRKHPMFYSDVEIKQIFTEKSPKELNDNAIKRTIEENL